MTAFCILSRSFSVLDPYTKVIKETMKAILICVLLVVVFENVHCAMSEAQLKSAAKLLRNVCQPKTKISNAEIEAIHQGNLPKEKVIMSYMECILRTGQIVKDGKLNYDFLKNQVSNLPADKVDAAMTSVEHCKDSMKSSDKLEAAYEFYKCFYEDNPTNFFLP